MNEENKKSKKKVLTYYLILAACILVIAAITVGIVFAVRGNRQPVIDVEDPGKVDKPDNPGKDDPQPPVDDKPIDTSTKYEFIVPMASVDVLNDYTFYHNVTLNNWHFHTGLDFAGEEGTNVLACLDGTVESIVLDDILDGNVITLSHENGIKTVYKFIDIDENLKVGDSVSRGDVIGKISKPNGSEYKDGAHLHFEILKGGESVDPEEYLDIEAK